LNWGWERVSTFTPKALANSKTVSDLTPKVLANSSPGFALKPWDEVNDLFAATLKELQTFAVRRGILSTE
jgi:hypothetical protein